MGNQIKAVMIRRKKLSIQSTANTQRNDYDLEETELNIKSTERQIKRDKISQNQLYDDKQNVNPELKEAIANGKLQGQKWNALKMKDYCMKIQVWNLKNELAAYDCKRPSIVNQISGIQFPYLKTLNLWGNRIVTIQPLTQCSFPCLEALYLWENSICSTKSLRRFHMPNLIIIDIKNNKITQHSYLSQLFLVKQSIKKFHVESREENKYQKSDIKWISKMQPKIFYQICLNRRQNRIVNNKSINSLLKGSCKRIIS